MRCTSLYFSQLKHWIKHIFSLVKSCCTVMYFKMRQKWGILKAETTIILFLFAVIRKKSCDRSIQSNETFWSYLGSTAKNKLIIHLKLHYIIYHHIPYVSAFDAVGEIVRRLNHSRGGMNVETRSAPTYLLTYEILTVLDDDRISSVTQGGRERHTN